MKTIVKTFVSVVFVALSSLALAMSHGGKKDIVDTAVTAGSFNTLVAAVQAAGLVDTLKSKGPFTVFAPTDAAFAKLRRVLWRTYLSQKIRTNWSLY